MERWIPRLVGAAFGAGIVFGSWAFLPRVAGGIGALGEPAPAVSPSWHLERIHVQEAWTVTQGVPEIVVAVIDSGIDFSIPELASTRWVNTRETPGNGQDDDGNGYVDDVYGWDFRAGGPIPPVYGSELHWHGTFVAGILAASGSSVWGVAPRIRLMDVRFLDSKGLFYTRDWEKLAAAIRYAVDQGARIINLSFYATSRPPAIVEQALAQAAARGVLVVGIAGNEARPEVPYPAKYPTVVAVAATDPQDQLASFSNWGPEVEVVAPGSSVVSLLPGGRTAVQGGTSFAAPHVAGTLALILSAHPNLSSSQALQLLKSTCQDLGPAGQDERFGAGLVQAGRAVRSPMPAQQLFLLKGIK